VRKKRSEGARGGRRREDHHIMIEDEELKAVEIESTRTIAIDSFVPRAQIDAPYLDSPYNIAPNGAST
jgi:non-homologous end joining protein Ku